MVKYRCKVCGGDITVAQGESVAVCSSCNVTSGKLSVLDLLSRTCACKICGSPLEVTAGKNEVSCEKCEVTYHNVQRLEPYAGGVETKNGEAEESASSGVAITCGVGGYVFFGSYDQGNGKSEPIEWQVLEKQGDRALLITRHAIEAKQFHSSGGNITWDACSLRSFLNGKFFDKAFNGSEKDMVLMTEPPLGVNSYFPSTTPGKQTKDKVFLLSIEELKRYFPTSKSRLCSPTKYAKANGTYTGSDGNCFWWLRSPGKTQDQGALVWSGGTMDGSGGGALSSNAGVRPAVWVKL